jgi:hypothetical protein
MEALSLAKTLGVLSFTPLTMLQAYAQAVDFKVVHHFGEGQGETSKDEVNARKTTNKEVLRRMVFLPRTVRTAGGHTRCMDWTRAGRSKSCLNQKDVQRTKSTLM